MISRLIERQSFPCQFLLSFDLMSKALRCDCMCVCKCKRVCVLRVRADVCFGVRSDVRSARAVKQQPRAISKWNFSRKEGTSRFSVYTWSNISRTLNDIQLFAYKVNKTFFNQTFSVFNQVYINYFEIIRFHQKFDFEWQNLIHCAHGKKRFDCNSDQL